MGSELDLSGLLSLIAEKTDILINSTDRSRTLNQEMDLQEQFDSRMDFQLHDHDFTLSTSQTIAFLMMNSTSTLNEGIQVTSCFQTILDPFYSIIIIAFGSIVENARCQRAFNNSILSNHLE